MQTRTLEQRIKFDSGLNIGTHLVRFTLGERSRLALARIGARGAVSYLTKPEPGDMYTTWTDVKGDTSQSGKGAVIVWGARNPEYLRAFDGEPVASIPVQ